MKSEETNLCYPNFKFQSGNDVCNCLPRKGNGCGNGIADGNGNGSGVGKPGNCSPLQSPQDLLQTSASIGILQLLAETDMQWGE